MQSQYYHDTVDRKSFLRKVRFVILPACYNEEVLTGRQVPEKGFAS